MSLAAIAALVVTAVLVAALAFYLIWVIVILRRLIDTLGKVTFGVRAIALRVAPIQPIVESANADLTAVAGALEDLVADLTVRPPAHAS
ncbi:hypothetical protein BH20ACT5_BH20ACT5_15740 [soil metagenome]